MNPSRRTVLVAATAAAFLPTPAMAATPQATPKATASATTATPPYASCFYPDSFPSGSPGTGITWRSPKTWTAAGDTDLACNAASVPLAARFTPTPANTTARSGQARIQSLVLPSTADGGHTGRRACFLTGLQPEQGEEAARFEVRAVGELYTSSDPLTVTHTW